MLYKITTRETYNKYMNLYPDEEYLTQPLISIHIRGVLDKTFAEQALMKALLEIKEHEQETEEKP